MFVCHTIQCQVWELVRVAIVGARQQWQSQLEKISILCMHNYIILFAFKHFLSLVETLGSLSK